jgi:lipopolysaccharide export system protein LptA
MLLAVLLLTLNLASAHAETASQPDPDAKQPINILADHLEARQKDGFSRYTGHVVVTQGSFRLEGDTLDVYFDNGQISRAIAHGKPAHFRKKSPRDGRLITGHALTITYTLKPRKHLVLEGNAVVTQASGETIRGARLDYGLEQETLQARGDRKQRVHLTIPPQQDTSAP